MTLFARLGRVVQRSRLPLRAADHGHSHGPVPKEYRNGFLFGEKPTELGQRRKRESWELIWIVGMGGGFLLAAVGLYFKPDTSLDKWANEELKRRAAAAKGE